MHRLPRGVGIAMSQSTQSPERVFRAICTNGVFRIRTRATIGPQNASLNRAVSRASASHSVAGHTPLGNGIAAWCSSLCSGSMSRGSRNPNPSRLGTSFISQGLRLIHEFLRAVKAPGSPSLLSLVHDANQPTRGFFQAFRFPPVLLPTVHAPKHERSFLKCLTNALKGQSL